MRATHSSVSSISSSLPLPQALPFIVSSPHPSLVNALGLRLAALVVGALVGILAAIINPPQPLTHTGSAAVNPVVVERTAAGEERVIASNAATAAPFHIPLYAAAPFALLLAAIAILPLIAPHWWHRRYPEVALAIGGFVAGYYLGGMGADGRTALSHAIVEYYAFLALVGGLYVASGGLLVSVSARGGPIANTALLAAGAILANIIGTTGASVVLIRPFMRINSGSQPGSTSRLHPLHIVFFIFIVSNCGGCLTPIGDPPLYLGFLKGVPFSWTISHLWPMWLLVNGLLLAAFFIFDTIISRRASISPATPATVAPTPPATSDDLHPHTSFFSLHGGSALVALALIVAGVFIDPALKRFFGIENLPIGATFQIIVACAAYALADRRILHANDFNFGPVKEVGLLFAGIFLAMVPALAYLSQNAPSLGLESPTQFYFATGVLSAVLDNAPTYLSFLQIAMSVLGLDVNAADLARFTANTFTITEPSGAVVTFQGQIMLEAISLGAVFFGALTYIGNGPNFMVKAIAEARGVRMPSFFAYAGMAACILGPILLVNWVVFIR